MNKKLFFYVFSLTCVASSGLSASYGAATIHAYNATTQLTRAARDGDIPTVKAVLDADPLQLFYFESLRDYDTQYCKGDTPFHAAVASGNPAVLQVLLQAIGRVSMADLLARINNKNFSNVYIKAIKENLVAFVKRKEPDLSDIAAEIRLEKLSTDDLKNFVIDFEQHGCMGSVCAPLLRYTFALRYQEEIRQNRNDERFEEKMDEMLCSLLEHRYADDTLEFSKVSHLSHNILAHCDAQTTALFQRKLREVDKAAFFKQTQEILAGNMTGVRPGLARKFTNRQEQLRQAVCALVPPNLEGHNEGEEVLHWAVKKGETDIVRACFERGGPIEVNKYRGVGYSQDWYETLLYTAVERIEGNKEVIQHLIEQGADPELGLQYVRKNESGEDEIRRVSCIDLCVRGLADEETRAQAQGTFSALVPHVGRDIRQEILSQAAAQGELEVIKLCVRECKDLDVNEYHEIRDLRSNDAQKFATPLCRALEKRHEQCVEYLLAQGANPAFGSKTVKSTGEERESCLDRYKRRLELISFSEASGSSISEREDEKKFLKKMLDVLPTYVTESPTGQESSAGEQKKDEVQDTLSDVDLRSSDDAQEPGNHADQQDAALQNDSNLEDQDDDRDLGDDGRGLIGVDPDSDQEPSGEGENGEPQDSGGQQPPQITNAENTTSACSGSSDSDHQASGMSYTKMALLTGGVALAAGVIYKLLQGRAVPQSTQLTAEQKQKLIAQLVAVSSNEKDFEVMRKKLKSKLDTKTYSELMAAATQQIDEKFLVDAWGYNSPHPIPV